MTSRAVTEFRPTAAEIARHLGVTTASITRAVQKVDWRARWGRRAGKNSVHMPCRPYDLPVEVRVPCAHRSYDNMVTRYAGERQKGYSLVTE
jgi:hypothetical protein